MQFNAMVDIQYSLLFSAEFCLIETKLFKRFKGLKNLRNERFKKTNIDIELINRINCENRF